MAEFPAEESGASAPLPERPTLGLVGIGAFGTFCIPHLRPHFDLRLADRRPDLAAVAERFGVAIAGTDEIAACDIVVLAVPLAALRSVSRTLAPRLRSGALVIDVCSIKGFPGAILDEELPAYVDIVGTHPLFGPQSGRDGIAGQRIAVCAVRGRKGGAVARFLAQKFRLDVIRTSATAHDREMAHVQALTHLVARVLKAMRIPRLGLQTTSFAHLESLVGLVGEDSEELFRTILVQNPFAREMTASFAAATREVLHGLEPVDADNVAAFNPAGCA